MGAPKVLDPALSAWTFDDVFDNQPLPGAYCSTDPARDFAMTLGPRSLTVSAFNYHHAVAVALRTLAAETGGSLKRCELCGAHLRYAALFFDPAGTLHVVGQECADRICAGASDRDEWALATAMKEAKAITTKFGPRWKVDLREPAGWRDIPFADRPRYVSMWTPKSKWGNGKPRLTLWAKDAVELLDLMRQFRAFLRARWVVVAPVVKPRRF